MVYRFRVRSRPKSMTPPLRRLAGRFAGRFAGPVSRRAGIGHSASAMTPGMPPRTGALLERASEALSSLPGREDRSLIFYAPLVRNNPYQAMLYAACWERGIAAIPAAIEE